MAKEIIMKCPGCTTVIKGKTGIFKKKISCPKCSIEIKPKKDAMTIVPCPHCGMDVMYDLRKNESHACLNCGGELGSFGEAMVEVQCPSCNIRQVVPFSEKMHECPACETWFDAHKARLAQEATENATASVVTVPQNNVYLMWRHPQTMFPYASQLVVPEGYTALILVNGVCEAASAPGNYVLSDTLKNRQEILEAALLNERQQISVEIYFVRNHLNENVYWGGDPMIATDQQGMQIGKLAFGGKTTLKITDAKAFASFVGYRTMAVSEIIQSLAEVQNGKWSTFYQAVVQACYAAASMELKMAAMNMGWNYGALAADRLLYTDKVRASVDERLKVYGVATSTFTIDAISYTESDLYISNKLEELQKSQNFINIARIIESPIDWESPEIEVHMKDNLTLWAKIAFGGTLKLHINEQEKFFQRSEVMGWIQNGFQDEQVRKYCSELVHTEVTNVINDTMQPMINDTNADIRDLMIYYKYIRTNFQRQIEEFFVGYGLKVESFSMKEVSRLNSPLLQTKTSAAVHKTEAEIQQDVFAFDSKMHVDKARIESEETINIDTIETSTAQILANNKETKAQTEIKNYATEANIQKAKNQIDYETHAHEAELKQKEYITTSGYNKDKTVTDIINQGEVNAALHEGKMKNIEQNKQEKASLHYLNVQEIEAHAEELRVQWEKENSLKEAQRAANAEKLLDEQDLKHKLSQNDAENERIINSIYRKIAESDMDLQSKKDAYERLISNQKFDDDLSHQDRSAASELNNSVNKQKAYIDLDYTKKHLGNVLTKEEKDYLEDIAEREARRVENAKNADFVRDMKVKEMTIAHEMEVLKMKYEQDKFEKELAQELSRMNIDLDKIKLELDAQTKAGAQEYWKVKAVSDNQTQQAIAESKYKIQHDQYLHDEAVSKAEAEAEREDKYRARADELLKEMMSIQCALQKMGLFNERVSIQENADVQKVQAVAGALSVSEKTEQIMEELKKMIEAIDKKVEDMQKHHGGMVLTSMPGAMSGTCDKHCPHCGAILASPYVFKCSKCNKPV